MIAIVDYGVGNLFSLKSSFSAIGADALVTYDKQAIESAEKIILPGVGAFADAAKKLRDCGLDVFLKEQAAQGKPLMGICLGMQLLFEKSYEYGAHNGLGLIKGTVRPIRGAVPEDLKIPHIGWNSLEIRKQSPIFKYINQGDFVYFVHSYFAAECGESIIATAEYGTHLAAAVQNRNIYGCQFHPEKSGSVGLNILKAFAEIREETLC